MQNNFNVNNLSSDLQETLTLIFGKEDDVDHKNLAIHFIDFSVQLKAQLICMLPEDLLTQTTSFETKTLDYKSNS